MIPGIRSILAGVEIGAGKQLIIATSDVAAAGTTQSTATLLTNTNNVVSAADGTKGVRLPPIGKPGQAHLVYSSAATNVLKVYPSTSGTINGGSANAAVSVAARTLAIFVASSATNWAANPVT